MTRVSPLQVGLIGLGGVGAKLLKVFSEHPETAVRAVCDADPERARSVSEALGGVPWFTDYRELLQQDALDFVYIGVPPKFHHKIALDAVAANKHILCEKPLANSLQEAEEMLQAVQQAGLVHGMNFPTSYRAAGTEFKRRLQAGFLGDVRRLDVVMRFHEWPRAWQQNAWVGGREQGGFTREVVPHYIQLIESWFGSIASLRSSLQFPADPSKCETGIFAELRLADGTRVLIDDISSIGQAEHIAFTAYGTQGTLSLQNWMELQAAGPEEELQPVALDDWDHLAREANEFIHAIDGKPADIVDFRKGCRIQRLLEALLESRDEWIDVTEKG